jgi:hypothetical protein
MASITVLLPPKTHACMQSDCFHEHTWSMLPSIRCRASAFISRNSTPSTDSFVRSDVFVNARQQYRRTGRAQHGTARRTCGQDCCDASDATLLQPVTESQSVERMHTNSMAHL